MSKINSFVALSLLSCLLINECSANALAQKWSAVTRPSNASAAQSIGTYTAGCISGAEELPINGVGFLVPTLLRHCH